MPPYRLPTPFILLFFSEGLVDLLGDGGLFAEQGLIALTFDGVGHVVVESVNGERAGPGSGVWEVRG